MTNDWEEDKTDQTQHLTTSHCGWEALMMVVSIKKKKFWLEVEPLRTVHGS